MGAWGPCSQDGVIRNVFLEPTTMTAAASLSSTSSAVSPVLTRAALGLVVAVTLSVALATIPAVIVTGAVFAAIVFGIYQVGKNVDQTFQALVEIGR